MQKTDTTTHSAWDSAVNHPLQSYAWGEFRVAMHIDVVRLDSWQITFHHIPRTPWTIGYFPKGPAPTKTMVEDLKRVGREQHAIFIQLEPNVRQINPTQETYTELSLKPSHHPLFSKYTFILDLTKSEEELLRAMHSKTRYNLRVAQKHGVIVKEDDSPWAFDAYLKLNQETTSRQGFYAHNETYHKTMWRILHNAGMAHLFTATYNGEILTAWVIFSFHDTIYYPYGASSRNHREVMAPTLMLWEVAKWAKAKGFKAFDLWGAMGPNPDPNDPWFGFHRFKQGFNPQLVEFVGSYDLILNPFLYTCYWVADGLRWAFLKFRAR